MPESEDEIVVTKEGRFPGCRGRVLVALIMLAALLLLLIAMLVRSMLSGAPVPPPPPTAAAGVTTTLARKVDDIAPRPTRLRSPQPSPA